MPLNRREICSLLPLAMLSSLSAGADTKLTSQAFSFNSLPVHKGKAADSRAIVRGKTPTGEAVEVHETTLHPGEMPHAPHHHQHSEFWLIREGSVEITINGQHYQLGPGSAAFAASNDEHSIKNVGATSANYFVVAIGPTA